MRNVVIFGVVATIIGCLAVLWFATSPGPQNPPTNVTSTVTQQQPSSPAQTKRPRKVKVSPPIAGQGDPTASSVADDRSAEATHTLLGEAFSRAGTKAVVVINNADPNSERAESAYDDVQAEMDRSNANEVVMLANLLNFKLKRENVETERDIIISKARAKLYQNGKNGSYEPDVLDALATDPEFSGPLQQLRNAQSSCEMALQDAFRHRMSISLPDSCK